MMSPTEKAILSKSRTSNVKPSEISSDKINLTEIQQIKANLHKVNTTNDLLTPPLSNTPQEHSPKSTTDTTPRTSKKKEFPVTPYTSNTETPPSVGELPKSKSQNEISPSLLSSQKSGRDSKLKNFYSIRGSKAKASPNSEIDKDDTAKSARDVLISKKDGSRNLNVRLPWENETFTKEWNGVPESEREKAIAELLITEQIYVKDLLILQHVYKDPLVNNQLPFKIKSSYIISLFSNIEEIISVNKKFLENLVSFVNTYTNSSLIGDLLIKTMPELQVYGQYITDYDNAIYTLEKIMKLPAPHKWLTSIQEKEPLVKNLNFDAFLIKPVQRIPRYKLFIDRLCKCTPKDNPDYDKLYQALGECESIASVINQAKEKQVESEKMSEIGERIDCGAEFLMVPGRTFIKDGQLEKITRKSKLQTRQLFLFSDVLMISPVPLPGQRFVILMKLQLNGSQVKDLPDDLTNNYLNRFQFLSYPKSLEFTAPSKEIKKEWMELLIRKTAEVDSGTSIKAGIVYQRDSEVKRCPLCNEKFTKIFRRHHCRQCCRVVCGNCTRQRRMLPTHGGEERKKRVCDDCIQHSVDWRPEDRGQSGSMSSDSEG